MISQLISGKKLFTATLLIFSVFFANAEETKTLAQAPAWQLKTQSGKTISSDQFKGQATILHFWATWCPYCKKLQPKLVELEEKYHQQGVKLVAISFNEDEGVLPQNELASRGYSFPTAVKGEKIASLYDVRGTPTTFFINKNNQVVFKSTSSNTDDPRLELAVKEIVK